MAAGASAQQRLAGARWYMQSALKLFLVWARTESPTAVALAGCSLFTLRRGGQISRERSEGPIGVEPVDWCSGAMQRNGYRTILGW